MPSTPENRQPTAIEVLCKEPFRVFFPLGLFSSFIGVSHWLWYHAGLTETYSCQYHGLFQTQGFVLGFAAGFLMTALPKFMEVPGARVWELLLGLALFLLGAAGLYLDRMVAAQAGYLALLLHLALFALRRFPKRQDTPPSTFILVPFGLLHAFAGGILILFPLEGFVKLGERLVQQGMVLAFVLAIGPFLGARLLNRPQPPPRLPFAHTAITGLLLFLSFWIEAGYADAPGKLLRACVVTLHLVRTLPILQPPPARLWHLRFLWLAFWCVPLGLWTAGLFPDYEIVALHVTFIGGFSLLTLVIATRVITAHCDFEPVWATNTRTVVTLVFALFLALITRLASDFWLDYYFGMLHIAAGFWLIGTVPWAFRFLPRLSPRHISPED